LSFCTDDTEWTFVGDKTLKGKEAVRQWMATTYIEPPKSLFNMNYVSFVRARLYLPLFEGHLNAIFDMIFVFIPKLITNKQATWR
jgi:hypothetical protein